MHGQERKKYLLPETEKYSFASNVIIQTIYDTAGLDISNHCFESEKFSVIIFDELQAFMNHKKLTKKI
ncbi:MAG: hypothetical protein LBD20_08080, partial [Spirochaetaceae bacterium]|nr:hypothetical protein [Spirochaetaceae bacterium]